MMLRKDIEQYCFDYVGVPYKEEPPFSLELGFNCLGWIEHLLELGGFYVPQHASDLKSFKQLSSHFRKLRKNEIINFPDAAYFYLDMFDKKHLGIMLNERIMSHSSEFTNGVSMVDITRSPWSNMLKGIYRLK